jgi:hypothetical protein
MHFTRSVGLPENVNEDDIVATLDKGVLTVSVPKVAPAEKPKPKRIAVQPVMPQLEQQVAGHKREAEEIPVLEGEVTKE